MCTASYGGNVCHHAPLWVVWLVLVIPQAGLCEAFALRTKPPCVHCPRARCLPPGNRRGLWQHQLHAPPPVASRRPTFTCYLRSRHPSSPPLSAANSAGDDAAWGDDGNPTNSSSNSSSQPRRDEEGVRAETQRLMSVPTIDIKLELQSRGVDHRDAFEKVDLARRLAELRTSSPSSSPSSSPFAPGVVGQALTETAVSDGADGGGGGGGGGGGQVGGDGSSDAASKTASTNAASSSPQAPAPCSSAPREEPPVGAGGEGKTKEDAVYAYDVSKAERMGKKAVTRELNAMGVAHSRLSNLSVLARQYASGRRDAREGAGEARRFRAEQDLEGRLEAARLLPLGRAELEARLRASGVAFSARAADGDLAALLAREGGRGGGGGGTHGALGEAMQEAPSGTYSGEDARDGSGQGRGEEGKGKGEGGERWTPIGRWGRATSRLPWNVGKKRDENGDDDEVQEGEEEEDEAEKEESGMARERANSWGSRGLRKKGGETGAAARQPSGGDEKNDAGSSTDWSTGGNASDEGEGGGGSSSDWSTRGNAGSKASSCSGGEEDSANDEHSSAAASERSRKVSLHARADRMSSRELMNALDDLGARYRIPAHRSELQQAFVSAALAHWNATLGLREGAERAGGGSDAERGGRKGRDKLEIVPISPYAEEEEKEMGGRGGEEGPGMRYEQRGFETYHAALGWARQLSFGDVLEELRYRGVRCNPKAGYSYLTRLLADEVLADEERMDAEEKADAYGAELESAMAMSTPEIVRALRACGERADVTSNKEALAEKLAALKLRTSDGNRIDSVPNGGGTRPPGGTSEALKRPNSSADRISPATTATSGSGSGGSSSGGGVYRQQQGWRRGGDAVDGGRGGSASSSSSSSSRPRAGGIGDLLSFGDGEGERDLDDEDALAELGEAARAVGDVAWLAFQETAAFVSGTAAGLFPEVFPEVGEESPSAEAGAGGAATPGRQQQRRRQAAGGGGGGGEGGAAARRARRTRAVRERAGGVRRALAGFAQSSANRAGLAVARSAANGALRGAEAAADWAGGGALAREYVLLFVAAFCLVFKRGIGASVALLILIKASRVTVQRLVSERRTAETGWGGGPKGGGGGRAKPQPAGAAAAAAPRRQRSSSAASAASPPGRRPRKGMGGERRRPTATTTTTTTASKKKGARTGRKSNARSGSGPTKKTAPTRSRKRGQSRGKPLWDESDDEDKGCVLM